jgi:hypothetical protein
MALRINGVTGTYSVPRVLKRYRFVAFTPTLTVSDTSDAGTEEKSVDVKIKLEQAWRFVTQRAAAQRSCNAYFKSLARGKTLKDVLDEGDITLHLLEPKEGYTSEILPDANTAGRDIGIYAGLLFNPDPNELACTLVHELAHVAGATSDSEAKDALAAERSLKSCLCTKYFRDTSLGKNDSFKVVKPDTRYA